MRARRIDSNDEWQEVKYIQLEGSDILYKSEYIEFKDDNSSSETEITTKEAKNSNWEGVRNQAAIAAMQVLIKEKCNDKPDILYDEFVAKIAVKYADALVEKLRKENK